MHLRTSTSLLLVALAAAPFPAPALAQTSPLPASSTPSEAASTEPPSASFEEPPPPVAPTPALTASEASAVGSPAPAPCPPTPEIVPVVPYGDHEAPYRAFSALATSAKNYRLMGGFLGVGLGVGEMGIGALVLEEPGIAGEALLLAGGITTGVSLISFALPSDVERFAASNPAGGHSASDALAFEQRWKELADSARGTRITAGIISLVLSGASLGIGIAADTGAFDGSPEDMQFLAAVFYGEATIAAAAGLGALLVPTPIEWAYSEYMAGKPQTTGVQLGLAPAPRGLGLGLGATF